MVSTSDPYKAQQSFRCKTKAKGSSSGENNAKNEKIGMDVQNKVSSGEKSGIDVKFRVAHNTSIQQNPYNKKRKTTKNNNNRNSNKSRGKAAQLEDPPIQRELQAGLVFEEDVDHDMQHNKKSALTQPSAKRNASKNNDDSSGDDSKNDSCLTKPSSAQEYAQHQITTRLTHNLPPILYHDPDFVAGCPSSIDGSKKQGKSLQPPKCRCRPAKPCVLDYSTKAGPNYDRPFWRCQKGRNGGCNHFGFAFTSHMTHWYRLGRHNGFSLVNSRLGYRAEDLVQGKVGDCWFLSALAVVAEREDLIGRLMGHGGIEKKVSDKYGVIEIQLFVDGYWKKIILDDFLPCIIDQQSEKEEENSIQLTLRRSMIDAGMDPSWHSTTTTDSTKSNTRRRVSSKFDPHSISDSCRVTLHELSEYLHYDRFSKDPSYRSNRNSQYFSCSHPLDRQVQTSDLAYSKTRQNQLWVSFIEKAYAKIHGSYKAISGGHVEEAFLDLTGAPTAVYNFDHHDFNPRQFWRDLMQFRRKRLPLGCGTSTSQGGIVGMHAYSILDVREIRNVGLDFFQDKIAQGTLGNVSGFTELDGTVRLLRIRNPHGQGEWKGEFSDRSSSWERLMANKSGNWKGSKGTVCLTVPQSPELKRTMKNDGTFWIDYDSFIMGFSNVDVVLAFKGNHAKSFDSNFPAKKSTHRCSRAFELSAVGQQPGEEGSYNETVEVYVMVIQKTKRGASLGRADRKVSYKACDVGILVGERGGDNDEVKLDAVDGRFFGMSSRNGHLRLIMNRSQPDKRLIIMPVSFGHPSATDEERSFVVRVVSDAPLLVRELPKIPQMNKVLQQYCFGRQVVSLSNAGTSQHRGTQGTRVVLLDTSLFKIMRIDCLAGGGGTVLVYLIVDDDKFSQLDPSKQAESISFCIEVNCRGMACRTAEGLEAHVVVSKGKKFEASWRRFSLSYSKENKSRLLAAVVQGGQDFQMGSVKCSLLKQDAQSAASGPMSKFVNSKKGAHVKPSVEKRKCRFANYKDFGLYSSTQTPPNSTRSECIDLSSNYGNASTLYQNQLPGINQNLDAAIIASIRESSAKVNSKPEATISFDKEIQDAIALSLKYN